MSYLNTNIRYLRKQELLTQQELAGKIGIKRSLLGAYEEGRAEPRIATMQKLAYYFGISLDSLINSDLAQGDDPITVDTEGKTLRILSVAVEGDQRERISVVPTSAEAGYAHSYGDPEYIGELASFNLPIPEVYSDQTHRLFQITGDSMLPVPSGSYILCTYIDNWQDVKDGHCYIVVTRDRGIVYKRVWNQLDEGRFQLRSDNPLYEPYEIDADEVIEFWAAEAFMSFDLPDRDSDQQSEVHALGAIVARLQNDMAQVKKQLNIDA